jgi:choline monooxygenase
VHIQSAFLRLASYFCDINERFMIDPNIKIAATPSGAFYLSDQSYELAKEHIFTRFWQYIGTQKEFAETGYLYPLDYMPGCLNEPLLLSVQENEVSCMSNVCTHRGFVLITEKTKSQVIRCKYHGRCFHPDGKFLSMPEFEAAENFPTRMDDLKHIGIENWNGLYFASLFPTVTLSDLFKGMNERLSWFPYKDLKLRYELSKDYFINANWALYCDNYLEGFHIPFVHKSLNKVIDYNNYETILYEYGNLQLGIAKEGEMVFDLPTNSPDYGKKVGAYYYWIFPNMMFNFYPWGLSLNIVQPQGKDKTKVSFIVFVHDEEKYNQGAGSDLHRVEMEDEEVVESVHNGLQSRLYHRGRYSPKMETGVHQFHMLLQQFMAK